MADRTARRPKPSTRTTLPLRIGHVLIYVRDMKRAVAFYRDRLGLACTHESGSWSEFATEGCTLALHHAVGATPRETGISFNVGNVDDTVRALRRARIRIVRPAAPVSDDIRCASFADPEGNILGIAGR